MPDTDRFLSPSGSHQKWQYDTDTGAMAGTACCNRCHPLQAWGPSAGRLIELIQRRARNAFACPLGLTKPAAFQLFPHSLSVFQCCVLFGSLWPVCSCWCLTTVFFGSVSGSRFDLQPAGGEAASPASLALPAIPRSQWNRPKDQTCCHFGEHHLTSTQQPSLYTL